MISVFVPGKFNRKMQWVNDVAHLVRDQLRQGDTLQPGVPVDLCIRMHVSKPSQLSTSLTLLYAVSDACVAALILAEVLTRQSCVRHLSIATQLCAEGRDPGVELFLFDRIAS